MLIHTGAALSPSGSILRNNSETSIVFSQTIKTFRAYNSLLIHEQPQCTTLLMFSVGQCLTFQYPKSPISNVKAKSCP